MYLMRGSQEMDHVFRGPPMWGKSFLPSFETVCFMCVSSVVFWFVFNQCVFNTYMLVLCLV